MLKTTLTIAALMLATAGAQAFQLNGHTPIIHQLNPQPPPPGAGAFGSGGGAGKVSLGGGFGPGKFKPADSASPKLDTVHFHNGTHIPK
jgi:hypothetical protein